MERYEQNAKRTTEGFYCLCYVFDAFGLVAPINSSILSVYLLRKHYFLSSIWILIENLLQILTAFVNGVLKDALQMTKLRLLKKPVKLNACAIVKNDLTISNQSFKASTL